MEKKKRIDPYLIESSYHQGINDLLSAVTQQRAEMEKRSQKMEKKTTFGRSITDTFDKRMMQAMPKKDKEAEMDYAMKVHCEQLKKRQEFIRELKNTPAFFACANQKNAEEGFLGQLCGKYAISLTEGEAIVKELLAEHKEKELLAKHFKKKASTNDTRKSKTLEPEENVLN